MYKVLKVSLIIFMGLGLIACGSDDKKKDDVTPNSLADVEGEKSGENNDIFIAFCTSPKKKKKL